MVRQGSSVGAWNAMPAIFTGWDTTRARDLHLPLEGKLQPGRELHQGGLAAAGRADHGGELAAVHMDREAVDRERAAGAAIDVAHVIERDEGSHGCAAQGALRSAIGGRNEESNASAPFGLGFLN